MWGNILGGSALIGVSLVYGAFAYWGLIGLTKGLGWAKFMEWKYPSVEVVVTSKKLFKAAGAVEAAASL
jgi:hypothetical protein